MAMPATAQNQPEDGAEDGAQPIVVTGSRIQRQDYVAPSPIVTVTTEAITDAGRATVDDYLRDLPQFTAGTGDFSNDSNGGTAGRSTLNLRALGPQRNLVIMDGRRLMSSGTDGAIDINTIPSLAIGNIEIISGGASATYGSDALSGVVNFKTRTDLEGFDVLGQLTTLDNPGEDTYQIGAAWGGKFADGRGRLLLSAEYVDRGAVRISEREFFLNPNVSSFTVFGRSRIGNQFLSVNDDGTVFNASTGQGYNGPRDLPFLFTSTGGVGFHGSFQNLLQVPLERLALFGKLDFEIAPSVNLYAQGIYSDSTANNVGAPPNVAGAPWVVRIPGTNPFLTQVRTNNPGSFGTPGSSIGVYQARLDQFGQRVYQTSNETIQALVGVNGQFGSSGINWDVHASYGQSTNEDRTISGAASVSALQRLLDAPDGGNSLCAGGYNPFGGQDPLSPACLGFVERTPLNITTLKQYVVEGNLEGPLFNLPAGEARFALTAQFRQNDYDFAPDADIARGDLANLPLALPTQGSIRALEIGGEAFLPVISGDGFLEELNLTLGYRFADYNLAGTNSTYKAEIDAHFFDDLVLLRGGYQRAVRAPNVGEFFLAGEIRVVGVGVPPEGGDPCDVRAAPSGNNLALCQFQGVASNYRASTASLPALTRGNRNLTPETADSFTAGAVFDIPLGQPTLQISIDYYNITINDAIAPVSARDSLQQCYTAGTTATPGFNPATFLADNFFCGNFRRDPAAAGEAVDVIQPILNLGQLQTSGVDFSVNFALPVDALSWGGEEGSIRLGTNINHLLDFSIQTLAGAPKIDFSGTISGNPQEALPRWRAFTTLTVNTGPISVSTIWRFTGAMASRSVAIDPNLVVPGTTDYSLFDLTAQAKVTDFFELQGGITNAFDVGVQQIDGPSSTNLGTFDPIGRTFFVGARLRF
jgi:outer membrane receptor protein involved in Fe transport